MEAWREKWQQAGKIAAGWLTAARRQGQALVRAAGARLARLGREVQGWVRQARERAAGWLRSAQGALQRARAQAGAWMQRAWARASGWVRAAARRLNDLLRRAARLPRWLRVGMGALIAAARRALEWAREQARRWVEGWRRRVADLVARARGAVAAARARGRALLQSVQARGRALLAGVWAALAAARRRAGELLEQARARGQALVDALRRRWDAARQQAAQWVSAARERGQAWVQRAREALIAARRNAAAAVAQAQARLAAIQQKIAGAFRKHPVAAWGTAGGVTLAAAGGAAYYVICYGLPASMQPMVYLPQMVGMGALPLVGMVSAERGRKRYGLFVGLVLAGMLLAACGLGGGGGNMPTGTPTGTPTPSPTFCPQTTTPQPSATPTQTPTGTPSATANLNSNYSGLEHLNGWIQQNQAWLIANGYPTDAQYWQNYYNQQIIEVANKYGISPALLKGLILRESNMAVTPIYIDSNGQPRLNYQAGGLVQLTRAGADTIFRHMDTPLADYYYNLAYKYAVQGGRLFPSSDGEKPLYIDLFPDQKLIIQDVVKQMFDGQCVQWEVTAGHCTAEQLTTPLLNDGKDNITLGAMNLTATQQDVINYVGQTNWASLPPIEQQKLIIATYKAGIGCIGSAIQTAQSANGGQIQNWNQVAASLSSDCKGETELYVNSVLCYASNMSEAPANTCASPNP